MGLEKNNEQHYREVVDKFHDPVASYQMTTRDYVLRPYTVGEAITITLPPVAEAKGRFYSIRSRACSMAYTITIQDHGDESEGWEGDIVLYATGQGCLLYSDGISWMLRTFADIEVEASPRGGYFKASALAAEATALRARGETAGVSGSAMGVHAQGIATGDLVSATVNALYAEAIAKDIATVTTIRGAMIACDAEGTPSAITTMYGAHVRCKTNVQPTTYRGLVVEHEQFGGVHALMESMIRLMDTTYHAGDVVATNGVLLSCTGTVTYGFHVATPTTAAFKISGIWGTGYNTGGMLVAADSSGTALALGATTAGFQSIYMNVTATVTGGENYHGIYSRFSTEGAMADGFIINGYFRTRLQHNAFENYSLWGRMDVNVAQDLGTGNMYLGVYGTVGFASGAHNLAATGGGAGVYGVASCASGGTMDQWLIGGYFECNAVDSLVALTCASRHRMLGYTDYGVDVLCQTNNNIAGIRINTTDSAVLSDGIRFESTTGVINHALMFVDADESDGASVAASTIDNLDADGVIKIDCAGTDYYIPFWDAGAITTEWADS